MPCWSCVVVLVARCGARPPSGRQANRFNLKTLELRA